MFPDEFEEGVDERVTDHWDLDWPLPVPRHPRVCPHCGSPMVLKDWKFHTRDTGTTHPWRCDVRMKCIGCSFVPMYGVRIPQHMYDQAPRTGWINWRAGKKILAAGGFVR